MVSGDVPLNQSNDTGWFGGDFMGWFWWTKSVDFMGHSWTYHGNNGKLIGRSWERQEENHGKIQWDFVRIFIWINLGKLRLNSLTWNKAMLGMIPLTNHDYSEGEQWGRDQIFPDYVMDIFVEYSEDWMGWCDEYWWTIRLSIGK